VDFASGRRKKRSMGQENTGQRKKGWGVFKVPHEEKMNRKNSPGGSRGRGQRTGRGDQGGGFEKEPGRVSPNRERTLTIGFFVKRKASAKKGQKTTEGNE